MECTWQGPLHEFANHYQACEFNRTNCIECNQLILSKDKDGHLENLCENRIITCLHCPESMAWKNKESHDAICPENPIKCPKGCKESENSEEITIIKQADLPNHLDNECVERKMPCPFSQSYCDKKSKFKRMPQHLVKYSIIHLNGLCTSGQDYFKVLENQTRILLDLKEKMKENERKITEMNTNLGVQLLWKIENIQEKYQEALSGVASEIISEPFFSTTSYGYKFIVRLVFNVKNTRITGQYMSVYISICENPFNVLLSWPFKQKINFHLVNQETDKHISHLLTPNAIKENFPFIQRPTSERNPYFGIEKFAKCNIFHESSSFTVGNAIYIKVVVEPHEIA